MVDQNFYYSLGRLVICPRCGAHSDLRIDYLKTPADDRVPVEQMLAGRRVCQEFHEDPLLAWLWFKYHNAHKMQDMPAETQPLVDQVPRDYQPDSPEDWGTPVGGI